MSFGASRSDFARDVRLCSPAFGEDIHGLIVYAFTEHDICILKYRRLMCKYALTQIRPSDMELLKGQNESFVAVAMREVGVLEWAEGCKSKDIVPGSRTAHKVTIKIVCT